MMGFRKQAMDYTAYSDVEEGRAVVSTSVVRFTGVQARPKTDLLAVEEPLEIQLGYSASGQRLTKSISVTMRTPGHDCELASGFLLTEGVVNDVIDIADMHYVGDSAPRDRNQSAILEIESGEDGNTILPYQPGRNTLRVELNPEVRISMANLERNFYTTSSCGICGKASLLALRTVCPPRAANRFSIEAALLYKFPERLRSTQDVFLRTGGLHAAGLFDAKGALYSVREDVGRHNAVDKLLGAALLADQTPLRDRLLMLSGRASFELLQKAVMSGVAMVVSVGAPSSLAVRVAKDFDIILVGFLREDHFNVYHGIEHLTGYIEQGGEIHEITN
jgi:FdhD protein